MASTNGVSVEQRLAQLEEEVRRLREVVEKRSELQKPGWRSIVGSHANSPEFAEIVRLGQKIRRGEIVMRFKKRKKSKTKVASTKRAKFKE